MTGAFPLGAHTFGFVGRSTAEEAFAELGDAGIRRVQLMAAPPHFDPWRADAGRTARLAHRLAAQGIEILALDLASHDVNLASLSADVTAFAVDAYGRAAERAAELGARALCIGSGRRHALMPRDDPRPSDVFRRAFADLLETTTRLGLRLVLENHPQGMAATAEEIATLLERDGDASVGVVWDVANAVAAGEAPEAGFARLGRRIEIVHLSDTPVGAWRHDPIGSGDIDFTAVRDAARAADFAGPMVLEILAPDPLAGIVRGAERLAADGWRFDRLPRGEG